MAGRKPSSHTTKLRELQVDLSRLQDNRDSLNDAIAVKRQEIANHKANKVKGGKK